MRRNLLSLLIAITAAIAFSASKVTAAPTKQEPPPRTRQTKPPQKPVPEPIDKPMTTPIQEPEDLMRRAITNLSTQIGLLADEMRRLRRETEQQLHHPRVALGLAPQPSHLVGEQSDLS